VQFVIICYVLILYVAQNTQSLRENYGELIHALLNYSLVYSMMVVVTTLTLWTGISHIIVNWKTIRELYGTSDKTAQTD
jgi:phosphatidylglycerophosphate synthase